MNIGVVFKSVLLLASLMPAASRTWGVAARRSAAPGTRAARPASSVGQDQDAVVLAPNRPVSGELKGGETRRFRFRAEAGQFARLGVERRGADLAVALESPSGKRLLEVSLLDGAAVQEPLVFVTDAAGVHTLSVRGAGGGAGGYEVQLEELRPATPQDGNRVAAERAAARAAQLQYGRGGEAALRRAAGEYAKALAAWQAAGAPAEAARALGGLAAVHASLREYAAAAEYYERQLSLLESSGAAKREAGAAENLGWLCYHALGRKAQALGALERALRLYEKLGERANAARARAIIGMVYNDLGADAAERARAVEYFNRALAAQRELRDPYAEGDALSNLMAAWKNQGRTRLAVFYGKGAVNVYQSLRARLKGFALEKDTQKTFLKSKEDTYRMLAELLIADGRLPEAQQVLEMLKEEEYFDFVRRAGESGGDETKPAAMTASEEEWKKRYEEVSAELTLRGRERGELLAKPTRTAAEERRLGEIENTLSLAHQAFEKFLARLSSELGDTKEAARVDQLRDAQALMEDLRDLGSGAVALYTVVGREKYSIILVTPDVQRAFEYPVAGAELARKVAAFRDALQNPRQDPLPLAQELYRILVGPVAKDLGDARAETLMWSLDGVLRYIPVAALHDGRQYLVEKYRNVVFTPASQARLKDVPAAKWRGFGFGVSKAQPGFTALPAVPEELRAVIRDEAQGPGAPGALPGQVLLDEAFTRDSFRESLRRRYPLVHIASHFAFRPGNETDSFLLLGDGSHLSLAELKSMANVFGGVELLTLSACNTATGGAGADGKEVEGFAVLAQRSGAKSVAATLWPVADASTRLLMQKFYEVRDAREGTLKVEALRQAQLALLRGTVTTGPSDTRRRGLGDALAGEPASGKGVAPQARYAHPFFWAPFILVGNWK